MWDLLEQSSINGGPPLPMLFWATILRKLQQMYENSWGVPSHWHTQSAPETLKKNNHHLFLPHILMGDFSIKTHSCPLSIDSPNRRYWKNMEISTTPSKLPRKHRPLAHWPIRSFPWGLTSPSAVSKGAFLWLAKKQDGFGWGQIVG